MTFFSNAFLGEPTDWTMVLVLTEVGVFAASFRCAVEKFWSHSGLIIELVDDFVRAFLWIGVLGFAKVTLLDSLPLGDVAVFSLSSDNSALTFGTGGLKTPVFLILGLFASIHLGS